MVWSQVDVNKPHLVYIILGGFTSLFMLCSSIIKERLYIGEATIATLCGIIFGPYAANLIDPSSWGNQDQITLEFSRIVLVTQCFAVGVELPRAYMERHWRSVTFLLVPVMTFGWLITSVFIWAIIPPLDWLDSLCVAACVTATDPVLASSVVGKGKFAKRVPKHLRDILSAESGCNDGMAFPFIYLALYLIKDRPDASEVSFHWFLYTIFYECVFGCIYGVLVGYIARRAIRLAHEREWIDRESFLVFYFVLALFCAGSGSILGIDDLLVGFSCGVGFSNDGWFTHQTEESHVSNVIDLLINLAFFVYFGTIIPWTQFNQPDIGLGAWRLVVIGILVILFRRIPAMLALKPFIPDVKTWREALFAGHFGPIGVGAIFVSILARAELENDTTQPDPQLPPKDFPHYNIIETIWPVTTFLVICSIVVHGSSIAVFTLGKHINTLTITMSYTQANEDGPGWMERLPRIASRSKSRTYDTQSLDDEKMEYPSPALLKPGGFLRMQRESPNHSRASSRDRKWRRSGDVRLGGPVSETAIQPASRQESFSRSAFGDKSGDDDCPGSPLDGDRTPDVPGEVEGEVFHEGEHDVIEDEEGNVLEVRDTHGEDDEERERIDREHAKERMREEDVHHGIAQKEEPPGTLPQRIESALERKLSKVNEDKGDDTKDMRQHWLKRMGRSETYRNIKKAEEEAKRRQSGPARAYQFGNTVIVEDADGEVIKKYDIPQPEQETSFTDPLRTRERLQKMTSYLGYKPKNESVREFRPGVLSGGEPSDAQDNTEIEPKSDTSNAPFSPLQRKQSAKPVKAQDNTDDDDDGIRFTVAASGSRRMSKTEFIEQLQRLDPRTRERFVERADVPEPVKESAREDADEHRVNKLRASRPEYARMPTAELRRHVSPNRGDTPDGSEEGMQLGDGAEVRRIRSNESAQGKTEGLALVDANQQRIPFHSVRDDLDRARGSVGETAAERRRRQHGGTASPKNTEASTSPQREAATYTSVQDELSRARGRFGPTAAEERRRRLAAGDQAPTRADSDSDDDGTTRITPAMRRRQQHNGESSSSAGTGANRPRASSHIDQAETAAERRRRLGALGRSQEDSDDDNNNNNNDDSSPATPSSASNTASTPTIGGVRFADQTAPSSNRAPGSRLRWGNGKSRRH